MSSLTKRRLRRNLPLTPWSNRLFDSWNDSLFNTNFNDLRRSFLKSEDAFKNDFFEDDSLMPAMNVKEHKNNFEIEFAAPGFNKNDFEVSIENDVLHVSANKEQEETKEEEDYSRKEFSYRSFQRSSSLPDSVDLEQDVKASYKNGILKITLLKKDDIQEEKSTKRVIEIN